jgi:hypothetical protein
MIVFISIFDISYINQTYCIKQIHAHNTIYLILHAILANMFRNHAYVLRGITLKYCLTE